MKTWLSTFLAAAALFAAPLAGAAEFPSQPIRIVVPFGPGGGTDVVARSLAEKLAPVFGVPVLVDNKPGGNSVIATRQVAAAPRRRPHAAAHHRHPRDQRGVRQQSCRTTR